jgi:DNA-directed RNA polymerase specialized sigma24 family protein
MVQGSRLPELTDEWSLLDRARNGDRSTWNVLLRQHQSRLTAMALLITGSVESSKDIVQEVFARLVRVEFQHRDGTLSGWLSTATWRLALKEKTRAGKLSDLESFKESLDTETQLDILIKDERARHVASAIHELSEEHRECVIPRG